MDDAQESEQQPVPVHEVPQDDSEKLTKVGFPEIEGDLSPAAMAPKACTCLQKHLTKLDAMNASFAAATSLSPLQNRPEELRWS